MVAMENEETTSKHPENGDGDRQVLAPSEGPREDLINTAIKFLQNPKVMGSPLLQKKTFLSKKGLTQEEINLAVERAGVTETTAVPSHVASNQAGPPPPPGYQPGMVVPYGQIHPPIPPQSRWAQVRDLTLASVVVASVSYAFYHMYKTYLEPLFRGKTIQEKRIDRLEMQVEEIHKSVNDSLSEISRTLAAIQLSINNQSQQSNANQTVGRGITDLKAEISSLRSLLLSKNQFPPPPNTTPMLPSWQLAGASSGGSQQQNANSPSTSITSASVPSEEAMSASSENTNAEEEDSSNSNKMESSPQATADQTNSDKGNQQFQDDGANTKDADSS